MIKKKLNIKKMARKWNVLFSPCIKYIYKIRPEDIPFSLIANLKCQNCGGYARKISCLPNTEPYYKWRERVRTYKHVYMIIGKTDGGTMIHDEGDEKRETWKPHPEYIGRKLAGASISIQSYLHRKMVEIRKNMGKKYKIFISGPCHRCKNCNVGGNCVYGMSYPSLEGVGVDVYKMLDKMGIKYECPAHTYLTMVSAVMIK